MVTGMDENTCITIDDCRTGDNNGNTRGAVIGDSKLCVTANAGNCSGFGGRSFAVATGCSASTETTAGVCEMNDGFELTTGVGCTAVCPNATDGYNTATSMCVTTPMTVAHCGVRRKVYKPTSLANPGGGGTCVGSSTTDASACDTGTALIGGRCNLAIRCISSANNRQGYNATMKTCVAPTAVSCNAARTTYVFNAMVGSGSAACFETAVGCDNDEAAITNTDSQLVCQSKDACLNVSGMTGYAGDTTNVCAAANVTTCYDVSTTAYYNGTACVEMASMACSDDQAGVRNDTDMTATCTAKATACTGGVGYLAGQKVCGVPTRQSDCAGLDRTYYDMRSGDDLCVASPTDCEADEAGITITGGNVCRGKEAACVGTVIGYDATNKICRVPQAASDCTSRDTLMIYNPRSGDHDVCVAAATNCDADEAVVSSTCTAKATACTGGAGYNGTTKACVPSGSVTGLAQCAGLTNMIYNEGDTANMGSCVLAAMNCDSGEAVSSGRCVEAASACTGMQGFNNGTRMCVAAGSVNNPDHCRAAGKVLLSASDNCAATCVANEAPGPDGRGRCRAATGACTRGQGYNSTDKVCISAGSVENENQCIGSTPFFNATERGDPTQGNCVANVGACDDNEKAGGTPTTMMTCVTDRVSVCSSMNQVLVTSKDKCRAPKNAKECLGNTSVTSTNPVFVPAALASGTKNECVAAATNCPMGSVAVAGSDGRTTSCVAATLACGTRNAAVGGYCASAQLSCPAGEGYDPATRMCSSVTGTDAEKLALCRNAGRHLNAAGDGCIVRVALCGAGNVLASDGVTCRTAAACRTGNGAVQGEHCVTASRNTCLADGGRAFNGTICDTPDATKCSNIGATLSSGACVETTRATRLTNLRGSGTNTDATMEGSGKQLAGLVTLRAAVQADVSGNANTVGNVDVMTGATKNDNRLRVLYANQPSLDVVGAAFAYHATDSAVNFGKGSTVSYVTDRNFGAYEVTAATIPGFDSSGAREILHRAGVTDFTLLREFPFIYDGSVSSLGTVRSTSEDGKMRLFFSEFLRLPGNRPASILVEDTVYQAIMSRDDISATPDTVGSVWSAIVRAAAGHYGLSVDTGRFARWYVASSYGSATPFSGTMATDVDRGTFNLLLKNGYLCLVACTKGVLSRQLQSDELKKYIVMIAQTEEDLENADTITLREVGKRYNNCRESNVSVCKLM